jgi:hypothetical protein
VPGNTGNLTKIKVADTTYWFAGWNTQADGNGSNYTSSFTMGTGNVILYAKWTAYAVGHTGPAGGKVFYDRGSYTSGDPDGDWRYMEMTTEEQAAAPWGLDTDSIATITDDYNGAPGTGKSNTALIVAKYPGGSYAANVCDTYSLNGYSDWFLPSMAELNAIRQRKSDLPFTADDNMFVRYWVSCQNASLSDYAHWVCTYENSYGGDKKSSAHPFIPIRRF